jgi:hypothetical protein
MMFPDTLHGFAVGYDGAVIRYEPKPVGLRDLQQENMNGLHIYPNPCDGWFRLQTQDTRGKWSEAKPGDIPPKAGTQVLRIYNVRGQKIKEVNLERKMVDVSDLPEGIYYIQLQVEDWLSAAKLVVKHH